jgi:hypothetical protein
LKKIKIEVPYAPAILLLGIYQKESKSAYIRDTCIPVALFTIVMESASIPING